jgi:hypothetical protein
MTVSMVTRKFHLVAAKKGDHMDYDHDFSHGDHKLQEIFIISLRFPLSILTVIVSLFKSSNLNRRTSLFAQNVPNVVHPVTDSLETEIEQYGKAEISTEMDVSYHAILIGTFSCRMLRIKNT